MLNTNKKPETTEFNNGVCWHSAFETAETAIERLSRYQDTNKSLLLTGETGVGKTFFFQEFAKLHNVADAEGNGTHNIVVVELEPGATVPAFLSGILEKLGDLKPSAGTQQAKGERLRRLVITLQVKLIVIDEVQELLPSSGLKHSSTIIRKIKWLMNNLACPIVLCGHTEAESIPDISSQIRSRLQASLRFEAFHLRDDEAMLDFADFLNGVIGLLPRPISKRLISWKIDEEQNLSLNDNLLGLLRLTLATQGIPRGVNALLAEAIELTDADEKVGLEVLADAWESVLTASYPTGKTPSGNPFEMKQAAVISALRKLDLYPQAKGDQ